VNCAGPVDGPRQSLKFSVTTQLSLRYILFVNVSIGFSCVVYFLSG